MKAFPALSIAIRQALLTAAVVIAATSGFAALMLVVVDRAGRAELLHTIDTDIAGLVDVWAAGDAQQLAQRIGDRTAFVTSPASYYLLTDATGHRLAGNLAPMRLPNAQTSASVEIVAGGQPVLLRATVLRGGTVLAVGRSLTGVEAFNADLRRILLVCEATIAAASLLIGLLLARRLTVRIERINRAFADFSAGDTAARVGAMPGRDEIATLAHHADHHLARVVSLIAAQREISDNIAHELRTPLGHLDTHLRRAQAANHDPAVEPLLQAARSEIDAVVSLFDALLDIALAESHDARTGVARFDVSELAAGVVELYQASAEEAGMHLTARIAPHVAMRGEPMQVSRIIANLLDNALRHLPEGSQIRLAVSPGPVLVVEDDGPGIPEADREAVFQRFRRSGGAGTGHGLGLALVHSLATRNGLTARIEDANPGARFIIAAKGTA
ncbi:HAMP domain-containing sensor histidine kinase [Novosphingobium sp.]|uniref:sensor histidine kinase n=1 Tax=Novosphingobium sp. TaxID=1874826 RepID=UPI00334258D6